MDYHLIYFGHETLREKAQPVEHFDSALADLVQNMFDLMQKARGIGLAAPQIGLSTRVIVIDPSGKGEQQLALVNPQIAVSSERKGPYEEGCLSVPGIYEEVIRPLQITVEGYTVTGEKTAIEADGIRARVLQHEIDHLDGILFIDRIEDYIRREYTAELKKIKKMNQR